MQDNEMDIKVLSWTPYPDKNAAETTAFAMSEEERSSLSPEKRREVDRIRAGYVERIMAHRAHQGSNYRMLGAYMAQAEWLGDEDRSRLCLEFITEHQQREADIERLTINTAFKALRYCPVPRGSAARSFRDRAPRNVERRREALYA